MFKMIVSFVLLFELIDGDEKEVGCDVLLMVFKWWLFLKLYVFCFYSIMMLFLINNVKNILNKCEKLE